MATTDTERAAPRVHFFARPRNGVVRGDQCGGPLFPGQDL